MEAGRGGQELPDESWTVELNAHEERPELPVAEREQELEVRERHRELFTGH